MTAGVFPHRLPEMAQPLPTDRGAAPSRMTSRVLVVEDDPDIAHLIELHLSDSGCAVAVARDGSTALRRALTEPFDVIVLDVMLPNLDGLAVCATLRDKHVYTPVLMLTARSMEADRVRGLELGADDYLTKPFGVRELLARVHALGRRADAYSARVNAPRGVVLHSEDLVIDVDRRRVTVAGTPVVLTAREFDLLLCFAEHPGRVYTRAQLLDAVWGYSHEGYGHTVNSHINRLRAKIERDPGSPRFVMTVWGVGYKFRDGEGE